MRRKWCLLLGVGIGLAFAAETCFALPQFNKEFKTRYVNDDVDAGVKEKLARIFHERSARSP